MRVYFSVSSFGRSASSLAFKSINTYALRKKEKVQRGITNKPKLSKSNVKQIHFVVKKKSLKHFYTLYIFEE